MLRGLLQAMRLSLFRQVIGAVQRHSSIPCDLERGNVNVAFFVTVHSAQFAAERSFKPLFRARRKQSTTSGDGGKPAEHSFTSGHGIGECRPSRFLRLSEVGSPRRSARRLVACPDGLMAEVAFVAISG